MRVKLKWRRIQKENSEQPKSGKYSDWKELIAEECYHQCVYCAISEGRFGGIRNFHLDHFRPKSKNEFKHLINDIKNLYLSCSICNTFKSDDWPAEPKDDFSNISYPDPSVFDYSDIFSRNNSDGKLVGLYVASKYLVEKLYLNRPQLILERRYSKINEDFDVILKYIESIKKTMNKLDPTVSNKYYNNFITLIGKLHILLRRLDEIRPYSTKDIVRKKENDI